MTPGRWIARRPPHGLPSVVVDDEVIADDRVIAERVYDGNESAIAALPELLSAAVDLSGWAVAIRWEPGAAQSERWLAGLRQRIRRVEAVARVMVKDQAGATQR